MTLMRAFSKVGKDGDIKLPSNIQREAGLKEGQLVELKIVGASRKRMFNVRCKEREIVQVVPSRPGVVFQV